jgi:hypothetical protein
MARAAVITEEMECLAKKIVKEATTARELRAGLSILIPKTCDITYTETAELLGISVPTVVRIHRDISNQAAGNATPKGSWGGRRRQTLSIDEETQFLAEWVENAEQGGVLIVPPIHAALERRLGKAVALSTVYRMLARHGWRKVEPDTCHPKQNIEAQEEFKKNSQRHWYKPLSKMY